MNGSVRITPEPGFTFVSSESVAGILIPMKAPVMEIEILRQIFEYAPGSFERDTLFDIHFSLFNALYRVKEEYGARGYYVHTDPMRIRMIMTCSDGCGWYDASAGDFCRGPLSGNSGMCAFHEKITGGHSRITIDRLREFYLDPENISFGDSGLLDKLFNGTLKFAANRREIEAAKKNFGIMYPTRKKIIARYRELARECHPDRNSGQHERMVELNRSYQILREVFIL